MSLNELKNAVYKINTSSGSGTGFYLANENVIVTNYHVIAGNKIVSVEDQNQRRYLAHAITVNPDVDLAFLDVPDLNVLTSIPFDEVLEVENRSQVFVLGFPFGMPYTETQGIISNNNQLMDSKRYIQTDAAVNPGNSGGPVVNPEGKLIGVTTAKFTNADNTGFAIPVSVLKAELETLKFNPEKKFSLTCSSCNHLVLEATDYCPNCGANIDEHIFKDKELNSLAVFIESAIEESGINPILTRNGYDYWQFHNGSSLIRIFVFDRNYVYATSPLNNLPSENLDALYTYLLEDHVQPYYLGVYDNQIFLSYRFHISDISSSHRETIRKELIGLVHKADEMDDHFVREFNCSKTNFSRNLQV